LLLSLRGSLTIIWVPPSSAVVRARLTGKRAPRIVPRQPRNNCCLRSRRQDLDLQPHDPPGPRQLVSLFAPVTES